MLLPTESAVLGRKEKEEKGKRYKYEYESSGTGGAKNKQEIMAREGKTLAGGK